LLEFIAGQITTQVAIPFFGPEVFVAFSDVRPQDRALAVQEATQYWPSLTLTETRQERGLDPLPAIEVELVEGESVSLWDDVPLRALDSFLVLVKPDEPEPEPIPPQLEGFAGQPSMLESGSPDAMQELEEEQALSVRAAKELDDTILYGTGSSLKEADNITLETILARSQMGGWSEPSTKAEQMAYDKWQTVALQRFKSGKAQKAFFDDSIPEDDSYTLATVLGMCASEAHIKAVFAHRDDYTAAAIKAVVGEIDDIEPGRDELEQEIADSVQTFLTEQSSRIAETTRRGAEPDNDFWDKEAVLLVALLLPFLERSAELGIEVTVTEIITPLALGVDANVNAAAAQWARAHALELAKDLNLTTRFLARTKIQNWLAKGTGEISVLIDDLNTVISPRWRAELIARTETTRAINQAARLVAQDQAAVKRLVWYTRLDELVCPICFPLHGKTATKEGLFPGGFSGPPAHPRCRCRTAYEV
jgi:SPP1 gp7 family putative phage head morphogenesis protein